MAGWNGLWVLSAWNAYISILQECFGDETQPLNHGGLEDLPPLFILILLALSCCWSIWDKKACSFRSWSSGASWNTINFIYQNPVWDEEACSFRSWSSGASWNTIHFIYQNPFWGEEACSFRSWSSGASWNTKLDCTRRSSSKLVTIERQAVRCHISELNDTLYFMGDPGPLLCSL